MKTVACSLTSEIKKAFRKMSRNLHPDNFPHRNLEDGLSKYFCILIKTHWVAQPILVHLLLFRRALLSVSKYEYTTAKVGN